MLKCDPPQSPSLCRDQWKEGRKGGELRPPGYQQLGGGGGLLKLQEPSWAEGGGVKGCRLSLLGTMQECLCISWGLFCF